MCLNTWYHASFLTCNRGFLFHHSSVIKNKREEKALMNEHKSNSLWAGTSSLSAVKAIDINEQEIYAA